MNLVIGFISLLENKTHFYWFMKIIRDNIWGDIMVSDVALRWIDTEEFQRLHSIKQTGLAYRVFPTATCTRFAHSLGAYHVTKLILQHIRFHQPQVMADLGEDIPEWICLAGLLHDIGHGPFSHLFDSYLHLIGVNSEWSNHENRSIDMISMMNTKYQFGMDDAVAFIRKLIQPSETDTKHWYSHIVHNPWECIDTDKMDYLVRDNHQFGLCMTIDIHRILGHCRVIDDTLCFSNKVQDELWNLFLIRHRLHSSIYRHPRITKFEKEVQCMLILMQDKEHFRQSIVDKDMTAFLRWTDPYILMHADTVKVREFDTRASKLINSKDLCPYRDDQFPKLTRVWFYNRDDLTNKFHLDLPSQHCPFSIPL